MYLWIWVRLFLHLGSTSWAAKNLHARPGCGDARVLLSALSSSSPPRQCIGVELDPHLVEHIQSSETAAPFLQTSKLIIQQKDMFKVDLDEIGTTAMVLYLLPGGLNKLKPQLERWLKGSNDSQTKRRIVTITYSITGWEPRHGKQTAVEPGTQKHAPMGGSTGVSQWLFYYDVASIRP